MLCALYTEINAQKRITFEEYEFCVGAIFNKVSNNGKYVAGYGDVSLSGNNVGFVYLVEEDSLICLNPEWADNIEFSHLVSASAKDVSNDGIVVGRHTPTDATKYESVPGFYNLSNSLWTSLDVPSDVKGKLTYENGIYGEATSISADGKYICGYVLSKMDNSTRGDLITRYVACMWIRTNDDVLNPVYELQTPIDTDHTKIMTQGDWANHMSDDGRWLGGHGTNGFGCFNVLIWENHSNDSLLDRTLLIGKPDIDREGDTNGDGVVDDEDGGADGQYWWGGTVSCISPSGEWICGYHSYNGTGYADAEQGQVGFRYNTITKELTDSLFELPGVIFDDGEIIYNSNGVMSSSDDKSVYCGTYAGSTGFGMINMPMIILNNETPVEYVEDLNINIYTNNSTLFVEGEFTSVEIYSVLGALVGIYNTNEISLANMNKGVYVVRIINGNQAVTKKISL